MRAKGVRCLYLALGRHFGRICECPLSGVKRTFRHIGPRSNSDLAQGCEGRMDFIERYLGISPDGGDGSLEAMLLIMLVTIITGIALRFSAIAKAK